MTSGTEEIVYEDYTVAAEPRPVEDSGTWSAVLTISRGSGSEKESWIVSAGDTPTIVADDSVTLIRHKLEDTEEIWYGNLKQGDAVRITSGPLRDLEAVF